MRTDHEEEAKPGIVEKVTMYLSILMAGAYVFLGVAVINRGSNIFNLPTSYSRTLGAVLIVYGLFRAYRAYKKYFSESV